MRDGRVEGHDINGIEAKLMMNIIGELINKVVTASNNVIEFKNYRVEQPMYNSG
jgi:hypothetical protein